MKDKGDKYDDIGRLGPDRHDEMPFSNPEGCKVFPGYGASAADLERGFVAPGLRESPEYDKVNYAQRYTLPKDPMEDFGNTDAMHDDYEFRSKDLRSRGFLTRPHLPTER